MSVCFHATCFEVSSNDLCPHPKNALSATAQSGEICINLLNSLSSALIFKACEVLVELSISKPTSFSLSSELFCLVVTEPTLMDSLLTPSISVTELVE